MNIVKFNSDTKYRKQFFTGLSFSHPAKMHLSLQLWLIEKFSKEGETILDPMAGSGTILLACTMGRNVITVELEDKFIKMQQGNWEKIQQRGCQLGYSMGTATILQGDARNLTGLLADKCIFSPTYRNAISRQGGESKINDIGISCQKARHYSDNPFNIGNLPYGEIDKIVTSPPYEGSVSDNKESPLAGGNKDKYGRWKDGTARKVSYTQDEPCKVDVIASSPPYEHQIHRNSDEGKEAELMAIDPNHWYPNSQPVAAARYIPRDDNIGNLKGETYLSAMLEVYQQCYQVLKDSGLMVLVIKNFIREKKQVRLDLDTIKLCEQAGFTFQDRWYRELKNQSFWRTIYHQKYPEVEPIKYEDVLVFRK